MHLYVVARGQRDMLNRWLSDLSAQYFHYVHNSLPGKGGMLRMGVREVKLLEITFPEEHLQEALKIVRPDKDNALNRIFGVLKRILGKGLEDVPEWDRKGVFEGSTMGLSGTGFSFYKVLNEGVTVTGIGIKKDARDDKGTELI